MSGPWHGGKGDRTRRFDPKRWAEGYALAFGVENKDGPGILPAHGGETPSGIDPQDSTDTRGQSDNPGKAESGRARDDGRGTR